MTTLVCVTPTYNAGRLVVDTIVSIKTQTVFFTTNDDPIEILHVIVDGNSTDDTLALAKKCYEDIDSYDNLSVLYVSEDDKGMYDAVTKGFALADKHVDGDIFCYLNAGDMFAPRTAEACVEIYKNEDCLWWTGLHAHYSETGNLVSLISPGTFSRPLIIAGVYGRLGFPYIQQESTFWGKELHSTISWDRFSSLKYAGDFFLWATFAHQAELKTVPIWLAGCRKHAGQQSEVHFQEYKKEKEQISEGLSLLNFPKAISAFLVCVIPYRITQVLRTLSS